ALPIRRRVYEGLFDWRLAELSDERVKDGGGVLELGGLTCTQPAHPCGGGPRWNAKSTDREGERHALIGELLQEVLKVLGLWLIVPALVAHRLDRAAGDLHLAGHRDAGAREQARVVNQAQLVRGHV